MVGVAYVLVGAVYSVQHLFPLLHQQRQLTSEIQSVQRETAILRGDLAAMRNPASLKLILTGKRPLPTDAVSTPSTLP